MQGVHAITLKLKSAAPNLRRLVWLALLLIHFRPALRGLEGLSGFELQASGAASSLFLLLTCVFCGLKVLDVRWLRVPRTTQSTVAWLVIVSLLHVNVVSRTLAAGGGLDPASLPGVFLVGGTLVLAAEALRRMGCAGGRLAYPGLDRCPEPAWARCGKFHSRCWISRNRSRGPPV